MVSADRHRMLQVLANLVGNAIKFSEPQRAVLVTVEPQDSLVTVSVQDRGPGIPAEALPKLLSSFYQVDSSRKRAGGGAGLGLYISKQIVESDGGQIGVESMEGKGTTFRFSLPRPTKSDLVV